MNNESNSHTAVTCSEHELPSSMEGITHITLQNTPPADYFKVEMNMSIFFIGLLCTVCLAAAEIWEIKFVMVSGGEMSTTEQRINEGLQCQECGWGSLGFREMMRWEPITINKHDYVNRTWAIFPFRLDITAEIERVGRESARHSLPTTTIHFPPPGFSLSGLCLMALKNKTKIKTPYSLLTLKPRHWRRCWLSW